MSRSCYGINTGTLPAWTQACAVVAIVPQRMKATPSIRAAKARISSNPSCELTMRNVSG